jgi:hypothetical protein
MHDGRSVLAKKLKLKFSIKKIQIPKAECSMGFGILCF